MALCAREGEGCQDTRWTGLLGSAHCKGRQGHGLHGSACVWGGRGPGEVGYTCLQLWGMQQRVQKDRCGCADPPEPDQNHPPNGQLSVEEATPPTSSRASPMKGKMSCARSGARTHDHKVKSLALYRLSYPGLWLIGCHRHGWRRFYTAKRKKLHRPRASSQKKAPVRLLDLPQQITHTHTHT